MFWKINHTSSAHIDTILCKDDLTLGELLDQETILQEVFSQNKKLIDFLLRGDIMEELVTLITCEPSTEIPEKDRYKHANIACELLTSEMPVFNERLAGDQILLAKLYSFLQNEHPLNPLLASFFSRTLGVLIARKSEQHWYSYQYSCLQVIEYLKSQEDCIDLLIKHLSTSAIMDLLMKLVTKIEGAEIKLNVFSWLEEKQLIRLVCNKLDPNNNSQDHDNAAQVLICIIETQRKDEESSVLLQSIESEETFRYILSLSLNSDIKSATSVMSCINILLQLLQAKSTNELKDVDKYSLEDSNGGETSEQKGCQNEIINKVVNVVLEFMPSLHDYLKNPPAAPAIILNSGIIDPPLGCTRLNIIKLLRTLLATQDPRMHDAFLTHHTFDILMDLFVQYHGNNFLHNEVEKCLNCALTDENVIRSPLPPLVISLFQDCKITVRLLDAYEQNEETEGKQDENMSRKGSRKGYMGHLFSIAKNICTKLCPDINNILNQHEDTFQAWQEFVTGPLEKVNEVYSQCLGGTHPTLCNNDSLDVPLFEDQQVFSFQVQPKNNNMSYNQDDFSMYTEDDDGDLEDFNKSQELFLKLCDDNQKHNDAVNNAQDARFTNGLDPQFWEKKWNDIDSSSDEEEDAEANSDTWDEQQSQASSLAYLPKASSLAYRALSNNAADRFLISAWSNGNVTNGEQEGWADFDAAFNCLDINGTPDKPLPSELTSTTASASTHMMNDVSAMSTSISNGLDEHEDFGEENKENIDVNEDTISQRKVDNVTSPSTSSPNQSNDNIMVESFDDSEEDEIKINDIHVIIDGETNNEVISTDDNDTQSELTGNINTENETKDSSFKTQNESNNSDTQSTTTNENTGIEIDNSNSEMDDNRNIEVLDKENMPKNINEPVVQFQTSTTEVSSIIQNSNEQQNLPPDTNEVVPKEDNVIETSNNILTQNETTNVSSTPTPTDEQIKDQNESLRTIVNSNCQAQ